MLVPPEGLIAPMYSIAFMRDGGSFATGRGANEATVVE